MSRPEGEAAWLCFYLLAFAGLQTADKDRKEENMDCRVAALLAMT